MTNQQQLRERLGSDLVVDTQTLKRLNFNSIAAARNRNLVLSLLHKRLDPDGHHLVHRVLFHNEREWRCEVYMKVKGKTEPVVVWLDISPEDYDWAKLISDQIVEAHAS